ncbi:MAG: purine-binding chemotaxis protein CheW [Desulfobacteraceae bacterium]|nr:MAG: purine-binding chemotaxis protein CheW [Desulfobacteraceae bacterium]
MLFLLFEVGKDRYCLNASGVIEVAPMVHFRKLPHAPAYVSGLINYRGTIAPVIDLSILLGQSPSKPLFSTRIILAGFTAADRTRRVLGLLTEKVTETIARQEADFQPAGITVDRAPFLGRVCFDAQGMIQKAELEQILPEDVQKYLFTAAEEKE